MKLYDLVYKLLNTEPKTRDSDRLLIWRVWTLECKVFMGMLSLESFLKATTPESITRCRRKIQSRYPHLQSANTIVNKLRKEKQDSKGTFIYREQI